MTFRLAGMPLRSGLGGGSRRGGAGGVYPLPACSAGPDGAWPVLYSDGIGGRRAATSSPSFATAARNACSHRTDVTGRWLCPGSWIEHQ